MTDADDQVRRLLRDLPEVAPPAGFFDELIRRRRRRARVVASGALVAAGVVGAVLVGHASGITGEVAPRLDELLGRHASVLTVDSGLTGQMPGDEVPPPFQAPPEVGPFERGMAVQHPDDVVQVVYAGEDGMVSVFEEAGDLDEGDLPEGVDVVDVDGAATWIVTVGDMDQIVVRRDHVVYVVVGDLTTDEAVAVVEDLPDARRMGLARRVGDAMDDLVTAFGLG